MNIITETITRSEVGAAFDKYGYVVLRDQFSPAEVAAVQQECSRLFSFFSEDTDRHNLRVAFRNHESGRAVLDRVDPFCDLSPLLKDVANDERILSPIADIFGQPGLLFKDKLILKGPGTHGYGVHQDYTNWQEIAAPADALLSVLLAVDSSSLDKGGLEFFPALHHAHHRDREEPTDIFNPKAGLVPDHIIEGLSSEGPSLQAGDLVLFHSLTPHHSGINRSTETRRSIYFSYNQACYGDLYESYYRNFYGYLRKDRAAEADLLHVR